MHHHLWALAGALFMQVAQAGPVDINSADPETLAQELNGVGTARARAIVDYRQQFGPFQRAEDLLNVTGVGEHILEANRENIIIGGDRP